MRRAWGEHAAISGWSRNNLKSSTRVRLAVRVRFFSREFGRVSGSSSSQISVPQDNQISGRFRGTTNTINTTNSTNITNPTASHLSTATTSNRANSRRKRMEPFALAKAPRMPIIVASSQTPARSKKWSTRTKISNKRIRLTHSSRSTSRPRKRPSVRYRARR